MIININTLRLNEPLDINQLVFLTIWYYEDYQEARTRSKISDDQLQLLELEGYLTFTSMADHQLNRGKVAKEVFNLKLEESLFKEFFDLYPKVAKNIKTGSKRVLSPKSLSAKGAINARKKYDKIVGKNQALHNHILELLHDEVQRKTASGDLIYMPSIEVYINDQRWEDWESVFEEGENNGMSSYGREVTL